MVRAQQQDNAGAEADYRQAVTLKPDFVDALQPLGVLFVETKRFDEGIKLFQRVLDYEPTRESARLQIVEALILRGEARPGDGGARARAREVAEGPDAAHRRRRGSSR